MKNNFTVAFLFIFVLIICCFSPKIKKKSKGIKKQEIADYYGISKPTLNKWIKHFQNELKIENWSRKRLLNTEEVLIIISAFGFEERSAVSKKEIADFSYSNYKTVSAIVKMNLHKIGITQDAWKSCNYFPATVSNRIIEVLG